MRAVIIDKDGKLFCVRLNDRRTKKEHDFWCVPGGGLDPGEALVDGLHREMIEETAIAPKIGSLLYVQQYGDKKWEELEFFFHVTNTDDYKDIDLSSATHAAEEIVEHGFVDPTKTYILPDFFATEDITAHIRTKAPTKFFSYF